MAKRVSVLHGLLFLSQTLERLEVMYLPCCSRVAQFGINVLRSLPFFLCNLSVGNKMRFCPAISELRRDIFERLDIFSLQGRISLSPLLGERKWCPETPFLFGLDQSSDLPMDFP